MFIFKYFIFYIFIFSSISGCGSLFYQPSKSLIPYRNQSLPKPKDIWMEVSQNEKINAWYFTSLSKKTKALILFFHGNAGNVSSHAPTLFFTLENDFDFLIFDYRGYGKSDGEPSAKNTIEDGIAALRFASVESKTKKIPLVVFCQSLGGAVCLKAITEIRFEINPSLVVVDSTFASYQQVGRTVLSRQLFTWIFQPLSYILLSDQYAPEKFIKNISPTPLVVMHGTSDQVVDYKNGLSVFNAAAEPKEFWRIENGEHIDSFWRHDGKYRKKFVDKINSLLPLSQI